MNKKVWVGAGVVFVILAVVDMLLFGYVMRSEFEATSSLWRPEAEMKMYIFFIIYAVTAFFFTLIFSKGYEGKGIMEGVRYGLYMALLIALPAGYGMYASMPVPYSLALKWFLCGLVEFLICGIALTFVFKAKEPSAAA